MGKATGPIFKIWTPSDDGFLRNNWNRISAAAIAAALGRTEAAVKARAYHLLGTTIAARRT